MLITDESYARACVTVVIAADVVHAAAIADAVWRISSIYYNIRGVAVVLECDRLARLHRPTS